MNTGTLELFFSQNGKALYNITLTYNDIVGTLYPIDGTLYTIDELQQQGIILKNKGMLGTSAVVKRSVSYDRIDRLNIKSFLYDLTGNSQSTSIKILDKLFKRGFINPTTQFQF